MNLLAAYSGADADRCSHGAHPKADWYDKTTFVSPLSFVLEQACQEYIRRAKQQHTRDKAIRSQSKRSKK
jgi:hypothetical protein